MHVSCPNINNFPKVDTKLNIELGNFFPSLFSFSSPTSAITVNKSGSMRGNQGLAPF